MDGFGRRLPRIPKLIGEPRTHALELCASLFGALPEARDLRSGRAERSTLLVLGAILGDGLTRRAYRRLRRRPPAVLLGLGIALRLGVRPGLRIACAPAPVPTRPCCIRNAQLDGQVRRDRQLRIVVRVQLAVAGKRRAPRFAVLRCPRLVREISQQSHLALVTAKDQRGPHEPPALDAKPSTGELQAAIRQLKPVELEGDPPGLEQQIRGHVLHAAHKVAINAEA